MEISLEKIWKIFWRNIIIIASSAVICAVAAYFITEYTIPKTYVSNAGFTVVSTASETNVDNPSYLNANLNYTRSIVSSKIIMLKTLDYYTMVAQQYNSDIDALIAQYPERKEELQLSKKTAGEIAGTISFSIIQDTELFDVNVKTGSPSESKMIADAVVKTANARLSQIVQKENTLTGEAPDADTVRCYKTPLIGSISGPSKKTNTLMGFLIGFILSYAVFFVINILDTRVKSAKELQEAFENIPVLGMISSFKTAKK